MPDGQAAAGAARRAGRRAQGEVAARFFALVFTLSTPIWLLGRPLPVVRFPVLAAAGCEELGWTGYALDPLQARWNALWAGIGLGVVVVSQDGSRRVLRRVRDWVQDCELACRSDVSPSDLKLLVLEVEACSTATPAGACRGGGRWPP